MVTSMEMKSEEENRTVVVMGRAEIDTRSPFKSVKEAVSLFGERVLVKEIYGYKLKEKQAAASIENGGSDHKTRIGALTAELEGARQSLQKTKEEITKMSKCTRTLKQELEETKKELKLMKAKEYYNLKPQPVDNDDDGDDNYPKIEDLKFVENANPKEEEECDQKRRFVTFASPPALAQVIVGEEEMEMKRSPFDWGNKKMTKKKPLMMKPLIGWLFSVKKSGGGHSSSRRETC